MARQVGLGVVFAAGAPEAESDWRQRNCLLACSLWRRRPGCRNWNLDLIYCIRQLQAGRQSRAIGQLCQFSFCTSVCRAK